MEDLVVQALREKLKLFAQTPQRSLLATDGSMLPFAASNGRS